MKSLQETFQLFTNHYDYSIYIFCLIHCIGIYIPQQKAFPKSIWETAKAPKPSPGTARTVLISLAEMSRQFLALRTSSGRRRVVYFLSRKVFFVYTYNIILYINMFLVRMVHERKVSGRFRCKFWVWSSLQMYLEVLSIHVYKYPRNATFFRYSMSCQRHDGVFAFEEIQLPRLLDRHF